MADHLYSIPLVILMVILTAAPLRADRLYHWNDRSGTIHLTQEPPPPEGTLQDVMDYTHVTPPKPEKGGHRRPKSDDEYTQSVTVEPDAGLNAREDRALALDNFCYLQAPGIDVYVRVWEPNDYGERDRKIWSGWIVKNQQQEVASQSGWIIYDYTKGPKDPFGESSKVPCSGGGIVRLFD
jgi:hypothetical protein